jgi:drug/metabolite transporter (DMT)-like permease
MWIILSLYFAIWSAISFVIIKKLVRSFDSVVVLFLSLLIAIPFMLVFLILTTGFPSLNANFLLAIFASAVIDVFAFLASYKAIKIASVSEIAPVSSFSPVFTLIFAMIFLKEVPTEIKLFGVIIVVVGAYFLNISGIKKGALEPIKKLASNKGVQLFFFANFLWAITPIFQKVAIQNTFPMTPLIGPIFDYGLVAAILLPIVLRKLKQSKEAFKTIKKSLWVLVILGFFGALSQYAAYTAFSLANLGYVISIFRLSSIFAIILGALFLKETGIREKLLGAVIMLIGAILVAI